MNLSKYFSYQTFKYNNAPTTHIFKVFGLNLVYGPHGNCSSPTIHLDRGQAPKINFAILTVRFQLRNETHIYFRRNWRIDWNCPWIARKFGKCIECDFGDVFTYEGRLGHHIDC